jgi:LysM repeat protein
VLNATTDGLGYFRFGGLEPGTYEVSVTEREGWQPVGSLKQIVTVSWPPKLECATAKFYDRQTPAEPDPMPSGCRYMHSVQYGETLAMISGWYGASVWSVMTANGIANPDFLYPGQQLCIP